MRRPREGGAEGGTEALDVADTFEVVDLAVVLEAVLVTLPAVLASLVWMKSKKIKLTRPLLHPSPSAHHF